MLHCKVMNACLFKLDAGLDKHADDRRTGKNRIAAYCGLHRLFCSRRCMARQQQSARLSDSDSAAANKQAVVQRLYGMTSRFWPALDARTLQLAVAATSSETLRQKNTA